MPYYAWTFTTGQSAQSGALTVTGQSPSAGATGVPLNAVVELTLAAPVDPLTVGTGAVTLSAGATGVAGTIAAIVVAANRDEPPPADASACSGWA